MVDEPWANKLPVGLDSLVAPLPKRDADLSEEPKRLLVEALKMSVPEGAFCLSLLKTEAEGSSIVLPPGPIAVVVLAFFSSFSDFFLEISWEASERAEETGSGFGVYTGLFWETFASKPVVGAGAF